MVQYPCIKRCWETQHFALSTCLFLLCIVEKESCKTTNNYLSVAALLGKLSLIANTQIVYILASPFHCFLLTFTSRKNIKVKMEKWSGKSRQDLCDICKRWEKYGTKPSVSMVD